MAEFFHLVARVSKPSMVVWFCWIFCFSLSFGKRSIKAAVLTYKFTQFCKTGLDDWRRKMGEEGLSECKIRADIKLMEFEIAQYDKLGFFNSYNLVPISFSIPKRINPSSFSIPMYCLFFSSRFDSFICKYHPGYRYRFNNSVTRRNHCREL